MPKGRPSCGEVILAEQGIGYEFPLVSVFTIDAAVDGFQEFVVASYGVRFEEGGRALSSKNRPLLVGKECGDGREAGAAQIPIEAAENCSRGRRGGGSCCDGRLLDVGGETGIASFCVPAMGSDRPRSLPLLATPFPQVNCVLYPEQSFPSSKH